MRRLARFRAIPLGPTSALRLDVRLAATYTDGSPDRTRRPRGKRLRAATSKRTITGDRLWPPVNCPSVRSVQQRAAAMDSKATFAVRWTCQQEKERRVVGISNALLPR